MNVVSAHQEHLFSNFSRDMEELLRVARLLDRKSLQKLGLTEPQQERFNEVLRGIDRRFAEVMARRG